MSLLELLPTIGLEPPILGGGVNPKAGLPAALDAFGTSTLTIMPSYIGIGSADVTSARIIPGTRVIETNAAALISTLLSNSFRLLPEGMQTVSRPLGGVPCATRVASLTFAPGGTNLFKATGAVTSQSAITKHTAVRTCGGIRLVYGNWSKSGETAPNPIKVQAALEAHEKEGTEERVLYRVTFNGQETITIPKGGYAISDIIPEDFAAAENFYVRTFVSVEKEGEEWPIDLTTIIANEEGVVNTVNKTNGGARVPSATQCYSPVGILSVSPTSTVDRVVGQFGDSIISGQMGSGEDASGGWLLRWLNGEYGYMKLSKGGETAKTFAEQLRSQSRMKLADATTLGVVAYGINDFKEGRTEAQIREALIKICERLARRGITVIVPTVTPNTTSTDAFATVGNQTTQSYEAERKALNAWILSKPAPMAVALDIAGAVESSPGSGKWKVGYTNEGTHPSEAGHAAIAAALPAPQITLV